MLNFTLLTFDNTCITYNEVGHGPYLTNLTLLLQQFKTCTI